MMLMFSYVCFVTFLARKEQNLLAAEVDSPLNSYFYVHWILDFKQLLLLLL